MLQAARRRHKDFSRPGFLGQAAHAMHRDGYMAKATFEEIVQLLGDDEVDDVIIERVVAVGASIDEIGEAIDDVEYAERYGEPREASSARVEEVRVILEEIVTRSASDSGPDDEDDEGLTVVDAEDLGSEQ